MTSVSRNFSKILQILLLASVAFMLMPVQEASAQLKIGYVDLQRALNEVGDGKKAKASLKKEFDKRQQTLDQKQEDLKKKKEDLEKQGMMLSEDVKRQRVMQFQKEMYELQQLYMQLQRELSEQEAKATKGIFDKMGTIIDKIGDEKDYDFILERSESSILFAKPGTDITDELIRRYNSK